MLLNIIGYVIGYTIGFVIGFLASTSLIKYFEDKEEKGDK